MCYVIILSSTITRITSKWNCIWLIDSSGIIRMSWEDPSGTTTNSTWRVTEPRMIASVRTRAHLSHENWLYCTTCIHISNGILSSEHEREREEQSDEAKKNHNNYQLQWISYHQCGYNVVSFVRWATAKVVQSDKEQACSVVQRDQSTRWNEAKTRT